MNNRNQWEFLQNIVPEGKNVENVKRIPNKTVMTSLITK